MKPMRTCRIQGGFSLVEVMVALVIIAVGLLGIAKMQALALASTGSAGTRSLVAIEAASLAASMHTNRDYWGKTPPAVTNVTVTSGGVTSSGPVMVAAVNVDVPTLASAPATCAPCASNTLLAAYDLQNWAQALGQVVPGAATQISCSVATPPLSCTIQITWVENVTSANSTASAAAAANNSAASVTLNQPQYTLYVEP